MTIQRYEDTKIRRYDMEGRLGISIGGKGNVGMGIRGGSIRVKKKKRETHKYTKEERSVSRMVGKGEGACC